MGDDDRGGEPRAGRRGALKALAILGGVTVGGVVGAPGVRMLIAPMGASGAGGRWVKTMRLDSLQVGEPKRVAIVDDRRDAWMLDKQVELGAVWLVRRAGDTVDCFSVVCPHLGCSVAARAAGEGFNCPCHDSDFAGDGARQSGPAPRALDRLATKIDDGVVMVEFRRFRQGTADKIEIG